MQRTPPKNLRSFCNTPLPLFPGDTAETCSTSPWGSSDVEATPIPVPSHPPGTFFSFDPTTITREDAAKIINMLRGLFEGHGGAASASRGLSGEFAAENDIPGDASFSSLSASNDAALKSKKRQAPSPEGTEVVVDVHPEPMAARRCLSAGEHRPITSKRRKRDRQDLDKIEPFPASGPSVAVCSRDRSFSLAKESDNSAPPPFAAASDPADSRIPPIVLRDKSKWVTISKKLSNLGLGYTKDQNIQDGIRIFPITEKDYRGISKLFRDDSIPHVRAALGEASECCLQGCSCGIHC